MPVYVLLSRLRSAAMKAILKEPDQLRGVRRVMWRFVKGAIR